MDVFEPFSELMENSQKSFHMKNLPSFSKQMMLHLLDSRDKRLIWKNQLDQVDHKQ